MRKAVQITGAAIFAAVLMTGCSSEGDDKPSDPKQSTPPAADQQKPGEKPADTPGSSGPVTPATLNGGWGNKGQLVDKSLLILSFADKTAMLSGKSACAGKVDYDAKPVTLTFNCKDGSTDYAKGTVKSVDGKTLVVSWASGKEDTFTKTVGSDGKVTGIPGITG
ncbi:hypothetical protein ACFQ2B_13730 [Streptomyces stramineus]|uniref:Lipoprotein n=1 Tax=Streptomyces stramineus TaxID=173861 RepID=A0ABP3JG17_9ACTN